MFYRFIGESYSGSIAVSKTVHGGSNPSSPVSNVSIYTELNVWHLYKSMTNKRIFSVSYRLILVSEMII